jgi:hypothetical protein
MIPEIRARYNALFDETAYAAYVNAINTELKYPADFRVCETPLFVSAEFKQKLIAAAEGVISAISAPGYRQRTEAAIPPGCYVPDEDEHPNMLQIDFAICLDEHGAFVPRLIELQGFPSLFCFQAFLDEVTRRHLWIPDGFSAYFGGLDHQRYIQHLRDVILDGHPPENVILLEIDPTNQKTRIDFAATEVMLGVRAVDLREVQRRGRSLYYTDADGRAVPIKRLYSRFIREDPQFAALGSSLWLGEPVDATWITHPNWYYKISKYALPLIRTEAAPEAHFLQDLSTYPADLENFVLKPLFLFSGNGVDLEVTAQKLDQIQRRDNYILQRKVQYAPVIATPEGMAKAEVRLLYTWAGPKPRLVCNLVRMSKGKMMGVRFNAAQRWVGSSIGFFPLDA